MQLLTTIAIYMLIVCVVPLVGAYNIAIYGGRRLLNRSHVKMLVTLFSLSLFIVAFFSLQKIILLLLVLLLGPLGEVVFYVIGSAFSGNTLAPGFLLLVTYGIGLLAVGRKIRAGYAAPSTPVSTTPQDSFRAGTMIATSILVVLAIAALNMSFSLFALHLAVHAGLPEVFRHPEWCDQSRETNASLVAECVQKSIPAGKTIYDYCDYLPYGPEPALNRETCRLQGKVATNDPQSCDGLKHGSIVGTDYADCIAHFVDSPQHAAYCVDIEQGKQWGNLIKARCVSDINVAFKDNAGKTPLFYARTVGEQNMLFDHGANPNVIAPSGQTALVYILFEESSMLSRADLAQMYYYEPVENILNHGANPNVSDGEGFTPLSVIVTQSGSLEMAKLLVAHGADVKFKNAKGESACELVAQDSYPSPRRDYLRSVCSISQ